MKIKLLFGLIPFFFLYSQNFEEKIPDFVLETKRIVIPSFPYAFNPSLIRWEGKWLMSFRVISDRKHPFNSDIGLVWLDDHFTPISPEQILSLRSPDSKIPCRAEDGRLIEVDHRLYLIYSDCNEEKISKGGFRVYVSELIPTGNTFYAGQATCIKQFPGETKERREKNWIPFDYQGNLLLAYSLSPLLVLSPDLDLGSAETFSLSREKLTWDLGEIRGGTPALMIDGQYLTFFHSSTELASVHSFGKKISHYFMGALTFSPLSPFSVEKISPEPIIANGFYEGEYYKPYWKPMRIIFPCGFVYDDDFIWVTYGREDHEMWVVKLDKKGLLMSLVPTDL